MRAVQIYKDPDDLERLIEIRLKREELLTRAEPISLQAVLDEAVLRRAPGGPTTMRAQLEQLLLLGSRPNVTIQIMPFSRRAHAGLDGSFTIIEFPKPRDPDIVYLEGDAGNIYLDKPKKIRLHTGRFNRLLSEALTHDESARLIETAARELK